MTFIHRAYSTCPRCGVTTNRETKDSERQEINTGVWHTPQRCEILREEKEVSRSD